ncbi:YHYH protein [uncultured Jannaschia sp.]|uniref:YHYH protein n=1 Tax=uncultured Jannaschia sp. TaxID=293347 RepID=UPI0026389FF7|nr:YHYH protein [uncultured Jannaschia sp.]
MTRPIALGALASLAALAGTSAAAHPNGPAFDASIFTEEPQVVDCTLEDSTASICFEFTVAAAPETLEIGPFCPATLDEAGGLWAWDGDEPGLYRLDRAFFEMLAAQGYTFYDEDGTVAVTDIRLDRPATDHDCLSASLDEGVAMTIRLPMEPRMAEAPTPLGTVADVGVGLDGVPIFADAPSVLETGHLPALDLCGGHVDPGGWYHWHATSTDMATTLEAEGVDAECTAVVQDAAAPFGFAFDGYPMFGSTEADGTAPEGLDACGGHVGPTAFGETYHYHASQTFPNLPACLSGVVAEGNFATTAAQGIGAAGGPGGPGGGTPPGFEEAAATLGIETEALMRAMQEAGGPNADLTQVAAVLGVAEAALRAVLLARP